MPKKSFIIHTDSLDVIDDLSDQQCAELFRAIKAHHKNESIELSAIVKIAFSPFKNQFLRDSEKYEKASELNSINGRKGGKRTQANARTRKRPKANQADSDSDSDSDSVNEKDNKTLNNKPSLKSVNGVPFQRIVDLYHEKLPTLPKVEKLTATRKSYIKQRWIQKDLETLSEWDNFFEYVSQSKFLMGGEPPSNGHKIFMANLEWLTKEGNFVKISEGNYHG